MTEHLRGRVGTPTVRDRTDNRSDRELLSDAAYRATAFYRAFDRFGCPTCGVLPGESCRGVTTGRVYRNGEANHPTRTALLWHVPCPTCHAAAGERCKNVAPDATHDARDRATTRARPGSVYRAPEQPRSYAETASKASSVLTKMARLAAEGRAPWQRRD